ncbi:MAG: SAM-dependent chlorinase/fluorinase [Bacteroidia bacterium]|nr:SAM-dependent chlorinase/fluorinase [Bacteroidia bacterium]
MPIITLTSDLGDGSHYSAIVKGAILRLLPSANLVDVTHTISNYDIMHAAYVVGRSFRAFPEGTVHVVAVDPEQAEEQAEAIAVAWEGHYFVGPNNGVLSLICDQLPVESRRIVMSSVLLDQYPRSFRAARVFAPAAAFLASGGELEELGPEVPLKDLRWGDPSYSNNCLRGKIIHIDRFGNAITNIHKNEFLELKMERRFEIFIRNVRLRRIVTTYSDVSKADALAIFGESDRLEIAMRETSAAELLGLKLHDMITIEFTV